MPKTYILGQHKHALTDVFLNNTDSGSLLIDLNGSTVSYLLEHFPQPEHVVLVDPTAPQTSTINLLDTPHRVLDWMREVAKFEPNASTGVFDQLVRMGVAALKTQHQASLVHLLSLLLDEQFRERVLKTVDDPLVRMFWEKDFARWSQKDIIEKPQSVLNKLWGVFEDTRVRCFLGYHESSVYFPDLLKDNKIILCRLPRRQLGTQNAAILGRAILMSFAGHFKGEPYTLYLPDCHHLAGPLLEELMGEESLGLVLSHSFLEQLPRSLVSAALGYSDHKMIFRISTQDAAVLERTFPHDNNLWKLDELPEDRFRYQIDGKIGEGALPRLNFPRYAQSAREIKATANRDYRRNRNRVLRTISTGM